MITVTFQNDTYTLPSHWDELTTQQFETLAQLTINGETANNLLFKFALHCMGMRLAWRYKVRVNDLDCYYIRHGIKRVYLVSPFQMAVLTSSMQWLIDSNTITPTTIKNPYYALEKFYGPADGLSNILTKEWILAEVYRSEWLSSKSDNDLNRFLAILWRPTAKHHPDGDMRAPFRAEAIDARARQMAKLKPYQKQVMLWFYNGCLDFLSVKFPDVFTQGDNGTGKSPIDGFSQMLNDLAKDVSSEIDNLNDSPLYKTLYLLQGIIEKANKKAKHNE